MKSNRAARLTTPVSPERRRTIVSVSFTPAEFALIAAAAKKRGQTVSKLVREAALHDIAPPWLTQPITYGINSGAFYPWQTGYNHTSTTEEVP